MIAVVTAFGKAQFIAKEIITNDRQHCLPEAIHSFGDALFFDSNFLISFPFLFPLTLLLQFASCFFGHIIFLWIVAAG